MIFLGISVAFFLLGQIGRASFNQQEINLYLYEVPYSIWVAYNLFIKGRILRLRKESLVLLAILVTTYLLGLSRVSIPANFVSLLYLLRLSAYIMGFEIVVDQVKKNNISQKFVQVSIFLLGVTGVIQYFLYSNLRNLQYLGWDPHQSRVFGQFFDTSVAGAVYGLILVFLLFRRNLFKPWLKNWIYPITYFLLGLFTYSRGYLLSIFSAAAFYSLYFYRNVKLLGIAAVLIAGFVFLAPKPFGEGVKLLRTSTIESRLVDYRQGIGLFQKNPFVGVGYNRIRYFRPVETFANSGLSHAGASFHSSYLIIAVTSGAIGLGVFLYWLFMTLRMSKFALISGVFIGVYSLFDNILLHPFILFLWPITIGLISRKKQ